VLSADRQHGHEAWMFGQAWMVLQLMGVMYLI